MYRFDPTGLTWTKLDDDHIPPARWRHAIAAAGDYIYLFGGRLTSGVPPVDIFLKC